MSRRPSLKINAISNWTSLVVQVAIGFFLTPFVIRHLGQSGYGVWVLVGSFIGYYGLLNLGVGSAITRYIARFSAQNDTENLNETVNSALAMFCITGIVAVAISVVIARTLATFFKIDHRCLASSRPKNSVQASGLILEKAAAFRPLASLLFV